MAKEQIIKINTAEAVKSIKDLKTNISEYKKALNGLEIGGKEYQETLTKLQQNQAALRNAMYGTAASMEEVQKASIGLTADFKDLDSVISQTTDKLKDETTSYNEYVRILAQLKEAWRGTTDSDARDKLAKSIDKVNDKLKGMDETVGVFGRNVGNYIGAVDHLTAGLQNMGKGAAGMVGPIKGATLGFQTLSKTPAIAILGLLANVLTKVIDSLKTSEENTDALTKAMAPLEAVGDLLTKMFQGLGKVVVAVAGFFGKLTASILGNNDAVEKRIALAEQEKALEDDIRANMVKNAKAERDIAELRAQAADKSKYTASERLAFLEEAGRKEEEIAAREKKAAEDAYNNLVLRTSMTDSSKEELDAVAKAEADMIKAQTDYYKKQKEINAGISAERRQEAKDARDAAKAVKDAAQAKINAERDYLSQLLGIVRDGSETEFKIQNTIAKKEYELAVANAKQKITDRKELNRTLEMLEKALHVKLEKNQQDHDNKVLAEELQSIANRRDALQKGSVEYAMVQKEYAEKALDGLRQQMDETDAEFEARQLEAQRSLVEAGNALNDALAKETADGLRAEMAALREGSVEQLALALELAKENFANTYQGIDESLDEFNARRLAAAKEVRQAEDELQEAQIDQDRIILEQRMAGLDQNSLEYLSHALELKQFELDSLHQMEGESNEAFRLRQLQAEKEYADAKKAIWQGSVQMMSQVAGSISSIIGSIADAYDEDAKNNKAAAQKAKNLRIAGATIDMLSGAVAAYSGAQNIPPPAGPIIGAINAAAVVAMGLTNIAKIKATQISTESGSAANPTVPAAVNAPTLEAEVNQVRTVTSATEEDRLNQMASEQRVYILDSDIQAKNNQNRVEVKETTF